MKIEDYGFIGDTHTGAIVGVNGSIDWLGLPRFDSDACFAALLGNPGNGHWQISPAKPARSAGQRYRGNTLILETTFQTDDGEVKVTDFMSPRSGAPTLFRMVEGIRGAVDVTLHLTIRFNYGLAIPWVQRIEGGITAVAGPDALVLRSDVPLQGRNEDLSTTAAFRVEAGTKKAFALSWYPSHEKPPAAPDADHALANTERFWEDWAGKCTYQGEARELVLRSLLTLKALTYAPTGGIVAAATTSLPEAIGGVRNWDYRFCWLRDATLTLYALMQSGYVEEAEAWTNWLLRAVAGDPDQMQIMYGVAGERRLAEYELKHLSGYENSRPVRIGNAASQQFQLDVYGEVMDAMHLARTLEIHSGAASWALQRHLLDYVEAHWQEPDEGLWEIRGPRRNFTHSKVMAWVAVDRAVKAVEQFGLQGDAERWKALREQIHQEVCAKGYNSKRQAFTQYYGADQLDASLLMVPLVGFLPVSDERVRNTVDRIRDELMVDGFVLRYAPGGSASVDGLPPGEGSFLPCSFWLVDCLWLLGRHDEAQELFRRLASKCSPLGLFSEEYDAKRQRQVGNTPQAFTHVGFVNAAHTLFAKHSAAKHRSEQQPHSGKRAATDQQQQQQQQ
ncbi:MAG: glycoside hydrolase family 15 protein, partial [Verrucomicrobia bacterium]|nr:glycoside hydrolase family 15 protein [Verrucomicrobiota bacterium]